MHLFKDFIPLKQFAQWVLARSRREEPGSPWYLKYLEGKALCKLNRCYLWLLWFSSKCRECLLRDYQLEGSEGMPKRPCHKRSLDQYPVVTNSRILQLLKEKLEIENYLCRIKGWSKVITLAFLNVPQPVAFLLCWCSVSAGDIHEWRIKFKLFNWNSESSVTFLLASLSCSPTRKPCSGQTVLVSIAKMDSPFLISIFFVHFSSEIILDLPFFLSLPPSCQNSISSI